MGNVNTGYCDKKNLSIGWETIETTCQTIRKVYIYVQGQPAKYTDLNHYILSHWERKKSIWVKHKPGAVVNKPLSISVESGPAVSTLTPVEGNKMRGDDSESRTALFINKVEPKLVDCECQTRNGSVTSVPVLCIPGETGELADISREYEEANKKALGQVESNPEQLSTIHSQMKAKKIKYKLVFTISVMSLLSVALSAVVIPWFLPYYHTVVFPILVIIRVINYTKKHWQLFCLDFCYFGNTALLVFCWAYPKSEALFAVIFGAATGPIAIAAVLFRNSVVFHDYDRMTSVYIHLMPILITYIIRWFPDRTSINWYFAPNTNFLDTPMYANNTSEASVYLSEWVDARWLWVTCVPFLWFTVHTIIYMLVENCIISNPKYLTCYKWLTGGSKNAVYHILTLGGRITNPVKGKLLWFLFSLLYGFLSLLQARLAYEFFIANTIFLILYFLLVLYFGASFYIDVFAKRGLADE